MSNATKHASRPSPVAISYAHALLELANEQKQAEPVGHELAELKKIIDATPAAREVLVNPAIGVEERSKMLTSVFKNNISPLMFNMLGVMNQHGRLGLLGQVAEAYGDLLDAQLGKVQVDLTVAQALSPEQLEQAKQKISQALGKQAVVQQRVDEKIIGGVVLRVGDTLLDASVKHQLTALKEQMLAAAPK